MSDIAQRLRDTSGRIGWYDSVGQWTNGGGILADAADHIEELERRCADKDANILQLIGNLQKAEAQSVGLETTVRRYMEAYGLNDEVPDRTLGETK